MSDSRLPAPLAPALLPRLLRRVARSAAPASLWARQLAERTRQAGLEPLAVALATPSLRPGAPSAVVVHEPGPPDRRAALAVELGRTVGAIALTPAEWSLWAGTATGARLAAAGPAWGELAPSALPAPAALRRTALRSAADLFLGRHASALAARSHLEARACAAWLRDELELLGTPSHFPPRPEDDARPVELEAATLGAFHAVFAAEVAVEPGEPLSGEVRPPRTAGDADRLAEILLADLRPAGPARALYLLPGPLGTRRSWQLVAVVPDEELLREAVRLRERLQQHLAMVPPELRRAVLGPTGPVVLTEAAAAGLMRRRLTGRPLRRLAARLHRRLLVGEDVLLAGLGGGGGGGGRPGGAGGPATPARRPSGSWPSAPGLPCSTCWPAAHRWRRRRPRSKGSCPGSIRPSPAWLGRRSVRPAGLLRTARAPPRSCATGARP